MAGKFLSRWAFMVLIIGAYSIFRDIVGWDSKFDWSRFADFVALGTLGMVLLLIYKKSIPSQSQE